MTKLSKALGTMKRGVLATALVATAIATANDALAADNANDLHGVDQVQSQSNNDENIPLTQMSREALKQRYEAMGMVFKDDVVNFKAPSREPAPGDVIHAKTNENGFSVPCSYPDIDAYLRNVKATAVSNIINKVKSLPATEDTERLLYEYAESKAYVQKVSEIFKEIEDSTLKTQMSKSGGHIEHLAKLGQGLNACLEKAKIQGEFSWDAQTLAEIDNTLWVIRESNWPKKREDVVFDASNSGPRL